MQISTFSTYAVGTYDMDNLQTTIQSLQQQIDTQNRVNNPSDDPVASTEILQLNESSGRNTQFISNNQGVSSQLSLIDTTLSSVSSLLSSVKSLTVQAGDGVITPTQLGMIQQTVNQDYNQLMGYANATNGRGEYLFGGNQVANPPFSADNALTATYSGDTGQRMVQITDSSSVPVTQVGSQVFGNATSPTALFDSMQKLSQLLAQNPSPANYATQLSSIMDSLDSAQTQIQTTQAAVGAAEGENTDTKASNTTLGTQYQSAVDGLQSLDMPQAISNFTMANTSLQYSQQVYAKVTALSLFNYMQ
jgi:flagellar hook-associated protein 3 FlgL